MRNKATLSKQGKCQDIFNQVRNSKLQLDLSIYHHVSTCMYVHAQLLKLIATLKNGWLVWKLTRTYTLQKWWYLTATEVTSLAPLYATPFNYIYTQFIPVYFEQQKLVTSDEFLINFQLEILSSLQPNPLFRWWSLSLYLTNLSLNQGNLMLCVSIFTSTLNTTSH